MLENREIAEINGGGRTTSGVTSVLLTNLIPSPFRERIKHCCRVALRLPGLHTVGQCKRSAAWRCF